MNTNLQAHIPSLSWLNRDQGQTMAEYAFIISGVAIVAAGAVLVLGLEILPLYQRVIDLFPAPAPP